MVPAFARLSHRLLMRKASQLWRRLVLPARDLELALRLSSAVIVVAALFPPPVPVLSLPFAASLLAVIAMVALLLLPAARLGPGRRPAVLVAMALAAFGLARLPPDVPAWWLFLVVIGLAGLNLSPLPALGIGLLCYGLYGAHLTVDALVFDHASLRAVLGERLIGHAGEFIAAYLLAIHFGTQRRARERAEALLRDLATAHAALAEAHAQLREDAARAVALAAAEERNRIAREIHDLLAHTLTVIVVQLQAAARVLEHDPGRARHHLEAGIALARNGVQEARRSVQALRQPAQEGVGLAPIQALARAFAERTGIVCTLAVEGEERPLAQPQATALYRAAQEALTNAARHGGAAHVWLTARFTPREVVLEARDDGRGPPEPIAEGGGLQGMRERAEALGGSLRYGASPAGGFALTLHLPLVVGQAA